MLTGKTFMYSLYNILLLTLVTILSPYVATGWLLDPEMWRFRLGYLPKLEKGGSIWFHGASVGEIGGLVSLLSEVRKVRPDSPFVVSAMTKTGRERALRELNEAQRVILLPLDFPLFVKRALRALKPKTLIVTETELWPNLLRGAREVGTQVVLVNGRVSDGSFSAYKFFRWFFRHVISNFNLLCVQSERDRERFLQLGAEPDRVHVTGSLKFDSSPRKPALSREDLGLPEEVPILVAGSTRPGEEDVLFRALRKVKESLPDLRLIVAPRHLHRIGEVETLASRLGLSIHRRSNETSAVQAEVLLLDSLGELPRVYGTGTVSFVGGTLLPYGGHNLLEPAFHRVPVIFGPYTESMRTVASRLQQLGGGVEVRDAADLASSLLTLLADEGVRRRRGDAAHRVAIESTGATRRTIALLEKHGLI